MFSSLIMAEPRQTREHGVCQSATSKLAGIAPVPVNEFPCGGESFADRAVRPRAARRYPRQTDHLRRYRLCDRRRHDFGPRDRSEPCRMKPRRAIKAAIQLLALAAATGGLLYGVYVAFAWARYG